MLWPWQVGRLGGWAVACWKQIALRQLACAAASLLFNASSVLLCLLCLPSPAQEEIAFKAARLQRVAKATAAACLETSAMAAEF